MVAYVTQHGWLFGPGHWTHPEFNDGEELILEQAYHAQKGIVEKGDTIPSPPPELTVDLTETLNELCEWYTDCSHLYRSLPDELFERVMKAINYKRKVKHN